MIEAALIPREPRPPQKVAVTITLEFTEDEILEAEVGCRLDALIRQAACFEINGGTYRILGSALSKPL